MLALVVKMNASVSFTSILAMLKVIDINSQLEGSIVRREKYFSQESLVATYLMLFTFCWFFGQL